MEEICEKMESETAFLSSLSYLSISISFFVILMEEEREGVDETRLKEEKEMYFFCSLPNMIPLLLQMISQNFRSKPVSLQVLLYSYLIPKKGLVKYYTIVS